jgi:hypothetical protein
MTAEALEALAARLRTEAARLDRAISFYVDPALVLLPQVWVGPAADRLEAELNGHRKVLLSVIGRLGVRASALDREATEIRAAEVALASVSGAV